MARDLAPTLSDMRRAIARLRRLRDEADLTLAPFSDERALVERFIEIISEASRSIPQDVKDDFPHMGWRRVADVGNHIRHAYHRVDREILLNIMEHDLDLLDETLSRIQSRLSGE
ncbi:MAG: DUF86 domain-containing protein [Brevundimonas sp.]|uniref:HepT-like ribonuclease domain-containing protein n=1 Tax=Brevundimonas sp. TaxID=1871086 RepID=UPI00391D8243